MLRQKLFLHSRERAADGVEDLFWWREDGAPMEPLDWHDPARKLLAAEIRTAAGTPDYDTLEYAVLLVLNAGDDVAFALPPAPKGQTWCFEIDSAQPNRPSDAVTTKGITVAAQSVVALVLVSES